MGFFISIKAVEKYLQVFWSRISKFRRLVAIYFHFYLIPVNVERIYVLCEWKNLEKKQNYLGH